VDQEKQAFLTSVESDIIRNGNRETYVEEIYVHIMFQSSFLQTFSEALIFNPRLLTIKLKETRETFVSPSPWLFYTQTAHYSFTLLWEKKNYMQNLARVHTGEKKKTFEDSCNIRLQPFCSFFDGYTLSPSQLKFLHSQESFLHLFVLTKIHCINFVLLRSKLYGIIVRNRLTVVHNLL